jgi:hypothetical protein
MSSKTLRYMIQGELLHQISLHFKWQKFIFMAIPEVNRGLIVRVWILNLHWVEFLVSKMHYYVSMQGFIESKGEVFFYEQPCGKIFSMIQSGQETSARGDFIIKQKKKK